jgi:hypothetical protein
MENAQNDQVRENRKISIVAETKLNKCKDSVLFKLQTFEGNDGIFGRKIKAHNNSKSKRIRTFKTFIPRQTGRLTVGRNIKLNSTQLKQRELASESIRTETRSRPKQEKKTQTRSSYAVRDKPGRVSIDD